MLYVPAYTHERRPYSASLYPTSFTLDSLPAITVGASSLALWFMWDFSCDCTFWDERGGGLTGQPVDPQVDKATLRTVLSINRVGSRSVSSICWAFWRTQTRTEPIRLLCIQLALPSTLSLPSGFAPSARLVVVVVIPYAVCVGTYLSIHR